MPDEVASVPWFEGDSDELAVTVDVGDDVIVVHTGTEAELEVVIETDTNVNDSEAVPLGVLDCDGIFDTELDVESVVELLEVGTREGETDDDTLRVVVGL